MLGREINTPTNLMIPCLKSQSVDYKDYVNNLVANMQSAHDTARRNLKTSLERIKKNYDLKILLKVALQIFGRTFYKNTKKAFLYSQSLLIFILKTPLVKIHPTTGEIGELLRPTLTMTGITVYFYMSSSLIYILVKYTKTFQT